MNHPFPFTATLCFVLLAGAAPAPAALIAVDSEFSPPARLTRQAGDTACRAGHDLRVKIDKVCPDSQPSCSYARLVAQWSSDGSPVGEPIDLGEINFWSNPSVSCSKRGTAIVTGENSIRTISPDGPLGPAFCGATGTITPQSPCGDYGEAAAATADGFFVAWRVYLGGQLFGRFVREDGSADGQPLLISDDGGDGSAWLDVPAAIAARTDRVLVGWIRHRYAAYEHDVLVALVDRSGVVSEEVALNQARVGDFHSLRLHRDGPDTFLATWINEFRIARLISTDENAPDTTTTTTTLDSRAPEFLPAQRLAALSRDYPVWIEPSLAAGTAGRWFASWFDGAATSTTDALRWTSSTVGGPVATNDEGRWIGASAGEPVIAAISIDDGESWSASATIYESDLEATWHGIRLLRLVAGPAGRWVAAWFEWAQLEHESEDGDYREDVLCGVRVAVSSDGGSSWKPGRTVKMTPCYGEVDSLALATDRAGSWVLAWGGTELAVVRSFDDGATWSEPVLPDPGPASLFPTQVDVAFDGSGKWLMALQAATRIKGEVGLSTIFLSESVDAGASWSEPAPFLPWHDECRGYDSEPSIACEGGRCGIAWMSVSGADGGGMDADILSSFSTDGGASWSAPKLVDRTARSDDFTDYRPEMVATDRETWGVLWLAHLYGGGGDVRFVRSRGYCGDGELDPTEECDDGNSVNGDGCDETCLSTGCGNAIQTADEQCDDGNADETDACLSDCAAATCGDGFVQSFVEPCDDGNSVETDGCLSGCIPAMCGDAIVQTGVEECDAGPYRSDADTCLWNCTLARCGDGFIRKGVEECDDGNLKNGDRCTKRCRINPYCDGPTIGGELTATRAYSVLRKAVAMRVRCPVRRCDFNGDKKVTSIDALEALRVAVGTVVAGSCEDRTLVIRLESPDRLGALQFHLDYDQAEGDVTECHMVVPDVISAMNLNAGVGTFTAGLISLEGFSGPRDVARCNYRGRTGTGIERMVLALEDSTDEYGNPVFVEITLGVE